MSLLILNGVTAYNKSFYIGFVFVCHKDENSYNWILSKIHELYTCVKQDKGSKVILTNKKDGLIADPSKVIPFSHYMLYFWHINKNIMGLATKYFSTFE